MSEFQVHKHDLKQTRIIDLPQQLKLKTGQVRVKIDAFSFTANNITYWAMGDKMAYWQFFPITQPTSGDATVDWGIIPAWGFAEVVESTHDDIVEGERLFGYFPTATEVVMQPAKVSIATWLDSSEHRLKLPPAYNSYRRVQAEPNYNRAHDALRMLLFPLHITSFCIHDMLSSQKWFGAAQIIILSASSKTSLGLAYAIHQDKQAPKLIGLTSVKNLAFTQQTAYYQNVLSYDDLAQINPDKKTVIVDMSGNGALISQLHRHLADNMVYSCHVGLTHWDETAKGSDFIVERSHVFFAPAHIQQRYQDWGPEKFERLANEFMQKAAIDSAKWLTIKQVAGLKGLAEKFNDVSQGLLPANQGLIVKL